MYATLLLAKADTTGAMAAVQQFMKLAPDAGRGLLVYANLLQARGQVDSALAHAKMAGDADSLYRPSAAGVFLRAAVKALQDTAFARADTLFTAAQSWATGDAQKTASFYRGVAQFQEGYAKLNAASEAYKRLQAKDQTAREPGCAAVRASTDFLNQAEANLTANVAINRETASQLLTYLPQFRTNLTQLAGPRAFKCGS